VIDFEDAALHDPGVDLAEFAVEVHSDVENSNLARRVIDLVIESYETADTAISTKVEYGLLEFQIRRAYQAVRRQVRQKEKEPRELL
jgi:thiamine kinase-like enzyme